MKEILVGLAFLVCTVAGAEVFILDFEGAVGSFLDDKTSGVYSTEQNGITLEVMFSAGGTTGNDNFNLVGSSFGINNSEGGDDTDGIDDAEYITMSFNVAGTFQRIEFDRLASENGDDAGSLSFGEDSVFNFDGDSDSPLSINTAFSAGQTIILRHTGDLSPDSGSNTRGFGLETVTVNIPEPVTMTMLGASGLLLLFARRMFTR